MRNPCRLESVQSAAEEVLFKCRWLEFLCYQTEIQQPEAPGFSLCWCFAPNSTEPVSIPADGGSAELADKKGREAVVENAKQTLQPGARSGDARQADPLILQRGFSNAVRGRGPPPVNKRGRRQRCQSAGDWRRFICLQEPTHTHSLQQKRGAMKPTPRMKENIQNDVQPVHTATGQQGMMGKRQKNTP